MSQMLSQHEKNEIVHLIAQDYRNKFWNLSNLPFCKISLRTKRCTQVFFQLSKKAAGAATINILVKIPQFRAQCQASSTLLNSPQVNLAAGGSALSALYQAARSTIFSRLTCPVSDRFNKRIFRYTRFN
jgi:hypothetical protein